MKKERLAAIAISLFLLAYVLEALAGKVPFPILKSPLAFLNPLILNQYPFTATAIAIRTVALVLALTLLLSFAGIKKLLKGLIIFILGVFFELYAIQQLATGMRTTPIEWTLSLAYAAILFIPVVIFYLIAGAFEAAHKALTKPGQTTSENNLPSQSPNP